jgi:hypothetical protein
LNSFQYEGPKWLLKYLLKGFEVISFPCTAGYPISGSLSLEFFQEKPVGSRDFD